MDNSRFQYWKDNADKLCGTDGPARRELYLIAHIVQMEQALASATKELAFIKAVNDRVGEVVVDMFKKMREVV